MDENDLCPNVHPTTLEMSMVKALRGGSLSNDTGTLEPSKGSSRVPEIVGETPLPTPYRRSGTFFTV